MTILVFRYLTLVSPNKVSQFFLGDAKLLSPFTYTC